MRASKLFHVDALWARQVCASKRERFHGGPYPRNNTSADGGASSISLTRQLASRHHPDQVHLHPKGYRMPGQEPYGPTPQSHRSSLGGASNYLSPTCRRLWLRFRDNGLLVRVLGREA